MFSVVIWATGENLHLCGVENPTNAAAKDPTRVRAEKGDDQGNNRTGIVRNENPIERDPRPNQQSQ